MWTRLRTTALAAVLTSALLATACGAADDGDDAATDEAAASGAADVADPAAVADAIESVRPTMLEALLFQVDPFTDYDAAYDWLEQVGAVIDELEAALPAALDGTTEEQQLYADMLASLDAWRDVLEPTRVQLEERRDELEPLNTAWVENRDAGNAGPPPAEYLEVIEVVNLEAATAWGDACALFVDTAGVTADCYAYEGPEPESDRTANDS